VPRREPKQASREPPQAPLAPALAARLQRWNKVGEGLARAGAGLGDKDRAALDGGGNALGHVDLLIAHAIAAYGFGQGAVGGKYFLQVGQGEMPEK
jgi:hypothetical protein